MMASTRPLRTEPGSRVVILAQRCCGPFRAAICRETLESETLTIRIERINADKCAFEPVGSFDPAEYANAVEAMVRLENALPEAMRFLDVEAKFLTERLV